MSDIPQLKIKSPSLTKKDAKLVAAVLKQIGQGNAYFYLGKPGSRRRKDLAELVLKFEFWAECGYTAVKPGSMTRKS